MLGHLRLAPSNWFRRDSGGKFLWPGFGENTRVLKWALDRLDAATDAVATPIGFVPTCDALDRTGLDISDQDLHAALAVNIDEWVTEAESIDYWYASIGGNRLPDELRVELGALRMRLAEARQTSRL